MRILLIALAVFAAPLSAQGAAEAVRRADSLWASSYASHDTTLAFDLFAEDLSVTGTNGSRKDRAGELADVRPTPGITVNYFRSREVEVRVFSDAAAVTGTLEWEMVMNGQVVLLRRRYTAVWGRGGVHGWRMVRLHVGQAPR